MKPFEGSKIQFYYDPQLDADVAYSQDKAQMSTLRLTSERMTHALVDYDPLTTLQTSAERDQDFRRGAIEHNINNLRRHLYRCYYGEIEMLFHQLRDAVYYSDRTGNATRQIDKIFHLLTEYYNRAMEIDASPLPSDRKPVRVQLDEETLRHD